jgi:cation:H+ antiporter
MDLLGGLPLYGNVLVFLAGALVVWFAGTRLARGAEVVAERTGAGEALIGALLLGGVTSLPEIAATVSASIIRNAPLAVNNVFGGIAMQVTILALADAAGRGSLTGRNRKSSVLLEGVLLIVVLNTAALGIAVGDTLVFGVGLWTTAVFALVIFALYLVKRYEPDQRWEPSDSGGERREDGGAQRAKEKRQRLHRLSTPALVTQLTLVSLAVLAGGFAVAKSGENIAEQTGLGSSFVGAILVAIATSLPEVSTTLEAVRLGARVMAISNIFGTNLFDAGLLFVADVFYPGPAVLNEVGRFALVAVLLGVACTTIYLVGIVERREREIGRLGLDSIAVVLVYAAGVVLLYTIR